MSKKPARGSTWRDTQTKALYRVAQATPYNVLLIGDFGPVKVPMYEWPGVYRPEVEEDEGEEIVALLVGGATGHHFQRVWEQAAELDVDIEYHWPMGVNVPDRIPKDVNLVIELVSHVSHDAYNNSKKLAKDAKIPIARAPSSGFQHALAEELKKLGFGDSFGAVIFESTSEGEFVAFIPHKQGRRARTDGVYTWTGTEYVYTQIQSTRLALPEDAGAPEEGSTGLVDGLVTAAGLAAVVLSSFK